MTTPIDASKPQLFAHRGTSLLAPENTAAAFDFALKNQCDVLETDVRLSRDGVVIVTHDETLERTTDSNARVRDLTLTELKKLDAGCQFVDLEGNRYEGEQQRLLTLDELFEQYPSVGINIDIKDNDIEAAAAVAKVVERHRQSHWVNVGSFHAKVIQHFRMCAPDASTAATRQEVARLVFGKTPTGTLPYKILQIPVSYWGIQLSRKRLIKKVQNVGVDVIYWTINDDKHIQRLLDRGANGVVTDRADIANKVFSQWTHVKTNSDNA